MHPGHPGNTVFYSIIIGFILSQGLKMILFLRHGNLHFKDLFVTGGMPSSHSAVVTALAVSVYMTQGLSPLFLTTLVLATIVIRDALGVRRTAGEEGKLLNRVIKATKLKLPPVHYSLGHLPIEVAAGVALGFVSAFIAFLVFV